MPAGRYLADLTELGAPDDQTILYAERQGVSYKVNVGSLRNDPADGDVVGPATSTDSALVLYDGTSGKLLKDGPVPGDIVTRDAAEFATAVQGGLADTALQPADIGDTVQAYDAGLADIAALTPTDGNIIVGNGTTWVAENGSTARTSLGLGSIATQDATNVNIDGGTIDGATIGGATPAAGTFTTLTVDTTTLVVDAANNRVGVGTASPGYTLDVLGTGLRVQGATAGILYLRDVGDSAEGSLIRDNGGVAMRADGTSSANSYAVFGAAGSSPQIHEMRANGNARFKLSDTFVSLGGVDGAEGLRVLSVASSVNFLQAKGATTGNRPTLSPNGSDTNISMQFAPKGTGVLNVPIANVPEYADDAAAAAGGLVVGDIYRTASALKIRVS